MDLHKLVLELHHQGITDEETIKTRVESIDIKPEDVFELISTYLICNGVNADTEFLCIKHASKKLSKDDIETCIVGYIILSRIDNFKLSLYLLSEYPDVVDIFIKYGKSSIIEEFCEYGNLDMIKTVFNIYADRLDLNANIIEKWVFNKNKEVYTDEIIDGIIYLVNLGFKCGNTAKNIALVLPLKVITSEGDSRPLLIYHVIQGIDPRRVFSSEIDTFEVNEELNRCINKHDPYGNLREDGVIKAMLSGIRRSLVIYKPLSQFYNPPPLNCMIVAKILLSGGHVDKTEIVLPPFDSGLIE